MSRVENGAMLPETRDEAIEAIARWVARQAERAYVRNGGSESDFMETSEALSILRQRTFRDDGATTPEGHER